MVTHRMWGANILLLLLLSYIISDKNSYDTYIYIYVETTQIGIGLSGWHYF